VCVCVCACALVHVCTALFFFKKVQNSDAKFDQRGVVVVIPMLGKKVLKCRSGLYPCEKERLEWCSITFHHKNTPVCIFIYTWWLFYILLVSEGKFTFLFSLKKIVSVIHLSLINLKTLTETDPYIVFMAVHCSEFCIAFPVWCLPLSVGLPWLFWFCCWVLSAEWSVPTSLLVELSYDCFGALASTSLTSSSSTFSRNL
jgi:hypothetical protein